MPSPSARMAGVAVARSGIVGSVVRTIVCAVRQRVPVEHLDDVRVLCAKEAQQAESRALQLKPGYTYYAAQLRRFGSK
jgi:hypothetical protein